ncbi:MAG TPA: hypothetical protein VG733_10165 [Chthoniobacteraceae bacterium]|nr:hypothetical protein [Chthoniobacteraceae bacterium]
MKKMTAFNREIKIAASVAVALMMIPAVRADQPSAAETKLRETLKEMATELSNARNDLATAQATVADDDQKIKDLTADKEALTKQAMDDKDAAKQAIADLTKKNADLATQLAAYKDALAKWEAGYKLAAGVAKEKETERAKLNSEKILLQRQVDDLETKNMALFQMGSEILTRYEKFGLGEALAAKEPFVGTTRVKLENQVQDYQGKLLNQKSTPQTETPPAGDTVKQADQQTPQKPATQSAGLKAKPARQ